MVRVYTIHTRVVKNVNGTWLQFKFRYKKVEQKRVYSNVEYQLFNSIPIRGNTNQISNQIHRILG